MSTLCVQVQFQVGLAVDGGGMRAVNIVSRHAFLRGNVESIKGQGQVCMSSVATRTVFLPVFVFIYVIYSSPAVSFSSLIPTNK